ncbi:hypothetical protein [Achromobacter sp. UMC71]|uniref:hypothetical protein n=1 Tax=Achromobacter sp. UMC71 TaxID=1862320 RepID=UPI0016004B2B|nr:hypothetical protein [Achromobacter sp. UMC71]MBB1627534.1 hypothetical protein [Achromobacter sp. UMC71]
MANLAFLHTLHVHAQYIDRAPVLAARLQEAVPAIHFYTDTQASLYARAGGAGRHYLLVEGRSQWLLRFSSVPHCPQLSGVIALVTDKASSGDRAKLMLAGVDICLPGTAQPREIVAALSVLSRMERRTLLASSVEVDDGTVLARSEEAASPAQSQPETDGRRYEP